MARRRLWRVVKAQGLWIRCRVNQVGGMGIRERLHRTFNHKSVFRDKMETPAQLRSPLPEFQKWYNDKRWHSSLGDQTL